MKDKRILVVDDESILRETLAEYFRDAGFECLTAVSAEEAVDIVKNHKIDLIITDVNMPPGMSGIEMIKHLYSISLIKPVIVITGYNANIAELQKQGEYQNVIKVFEKPFDCDEIIMVAQRSLSGSEKTA